MMYKNKIKSNKLHYLCLMYHYFCGLGKKTGFSKHNCWNLHQKCIWIILEELFLKAKQVLIGACICWNIIPACVLPFHGLMKWVLHTACQAVSLCDGVFSCFFCISKQPSDITTAPSTGDSVHLRIEQLPYIYVASVLKLCECFKVIYTGIMSSSLSIIILNLF